MNRDFHDRTCRSRARDNHWLRLTGDDQRQSECVRWSVAMRRILLAAIMFGAASGAQAADLPFLRGSFTDGLTTRPADWQGYYVGGQVGYGTSNMNFSSSTEHDRRDMQSTVRALESERAADLVWPVAGARSRIHSNGFGGVRRLQLAVGRRRPRRRSELPAWRVSADRSPASMADHALQSGSDQRRDRINPFVGGDRDVRYRPRCACAPAMSWGASCPMRLAASRSAGQTSLRPPAFRCAGHRATLRR